MIRRSCAVLVLLGVSVGFAQTEDVIHTIFGARELVKLRPNPFGGAPIEVPVAAQKPVPPPLPPIPPPPGLCWLDTTDGLRHSNECKSFRKTKRGRLCAPGEFARNGSRMQ